jgi:hypothetical protein
MNDIERNRKDAKRRVADEKRKRREHSFGDGGSADWSGVDGSVLAKAVAAVARHGGAIRLGYTRDGGAYAVGIYGDGEPFTEYIPPSEDLTAYLKGVIEDYDG